MESIIGLVGLAITAVGSVVAAYVSTKNRQESEKSARDARDYRERREKIDTAKWKVLLATQEGVDVLLRQAKGERLNGNVEAALNGIEEAKDELTRVQIENLVKE